jgi:hypothetical protein
MTATSSPWPQSQGSRFAWSPARIDHAVHATCTGRDLSFIGLFNGAPDLSERSEEILREEFAKRADADR